MDEFAVSNNNEFEETPALPIRKVSNVNGAGGGASLVKKAMQEANQ